MEPTCQAKTQSGQPCRAPADASGFCAFHDPARAAERAEGRRRGGLRRAGSIARKVLDSAEVPVELRDAGQVRDLLGNTIRAVLCGGLDMRIGATVGGLATVLLKSLEQGELAERLAALELAVQERHRGFA